MGVACIPLSSRGSQLIRFTERLVDHHAAVVVAP
jgi:hypothetical protein